MPILILSTLVSILAIAHVIKTGRSSLWIMVLFSLPVVGALAYFVVEILPGLSSGQGGRKVAQSVDKVLNPNKTLEEAKRDFEISDTVENACNLADIYVEREQFQQAAGLYRGALTGLNEHNPDILRKLSQCEFEAGNFSESRVLLDRLIEKNPHYKSQDAHLLYARSLHELGDVAAASEEYEALIKYYTGPEPAYHFAILMKSAGDMARAGELFSGIVKKAELSPAHYRKMHRHWIDLAEKELSAGV